MSTLVFVFGEEPEKYQHMWIEQGIVKGQIYSIGRTKAQIFLGIPYAEPPIGELRFKVDLFEVKTPHQSMSVV